jgi:parallel beta-helix repeat protein
MSNEKINLNRFANSFLNASFKKKVVAGLLIIGVILSLTLFVHEGGNVTLNLDVQARLDYLEVQQQLLNETINNPINSTISAMLKLCSYIVSIHGAYTCLINGTDDRAGRLETFDTNSTAIFSAAVGYMTSGGLLFAKGGRYHANIPLTSDITFKGEGASTIIVANGNFNAIRVFGTPTVHKYNVTISDLQLIGNDSNVNTLNYGIYMYYATNCLVERVYTSGFGAPAAIVVGAAIGCTVRNCWINNASVNGLGLGEGSYYNTFEDNHITNTRQFNGIDLNGVADRCDYNQIRDNIIRDCNVSGICLDSANNNTIRGNSIYNCRMGIGLGGSLSSSNNVVENNYVTGSWGPSSTGHGIHIQTATSLNNDIKANTLVKNLANGILLSGSFGLVSDNTCWGNGRGIDIYGDGYVIKNNFCVNNTAVPNIRSTADFTILTGNAFEGIVNAGTNTILGAGNTWNYVDVVSSWLNATNIATDYLFLGCLTSDPVIPVAGQMWYNSVEDTLKYYNGTGIVLIPSIGGGSNASYTLPYYYINYVSGSMYYSEKYDGTITNSTNYSGLVNSEIVALPSTGATIFNRAGNYTATSSMNINRTGVELRGEGRGTRINKAFNGNLIEMSGSGVWFQAVRDMYLYGNKASYTGCGIHLLYDYASTDPQPILENLYINNMASHGIYLEGGGTREVKATNILVRQAGGCGFLLGGTDGKYNDLVAEDCDQSGFETNGGSNQFVNCKAFGCGNDGATYYGMNIGGYWNIITGCFMQDNEYHGFRINGLVCTVTGCVSQNNGHIGSAGYGLILAANSDGTTVTGCQFLDDLGVQDYGIYIYANSINNVISANGFSGNDIAPVYVGDSNNKIFGNGGYVTENTILNVANTTATTFVFNHGCASTVDSVVPSFNFTGWTSWTWTSTTTQVTITVTGTLPVAMELLAVDVKYIP